MEDRAPCLRMRHNLFPVDTIARDRWGQLIDNAFHEAALPEQAAQVLRPFFAHVATFLINRQT